jgi:hypothetical protein
VDRQDLSIIGQDIRHIKSAPRALHSYDRPLFQNTLFWFTWTIPPLILLGAFGYQRSQRRLRDDVAYARNRRSGKQAQKRLRTARRLLREDDADAFYGEVSRALREYLGDKMNVSARGLTLNDIRQALQGRGADQQLVEQVIACCEAGDMGRFAPGAGTQEDMKRLLRATEDAITGLEGMQWHRN